MRLFFLLLISLLFIGGLQAQAAAGTTAKDTSWTFASSFGLDLSGLGIINPKIGAGTSRFGLGGLGTVSANRKTDKAFWNNQFSLQLATQRQGRSSLTQPDGFQKNLDVLRLTSTYGRKISGDKLYVSVDLLAQSQLLKTYKSNYLKPVPASVDSDYVVSKFLSPALPNTLGMRC